MAMFKMENAWAGYPQTCIVSGQVIPNGASAAAINTVIQPAAIAVTANANGAQLGPQNNVLPLSSKVPAVINPTPAYKPAVASNGPGTGCIMLDLSGYPGNLVSMQVQARVTTTATAGNASAGNFSAVLMDFDQTNKFVYVGLLNPAGAYQSWTNQHTLMYTAVFIDSAYP